MWENLGGSLFGYHKSTIGTLKRELNLENLIGAYGAFMGDKARLLVVLLVTRQAVRYWSHHGSVCW